MNICKTKTKVEYWIYKVHCMNSSFGVNKERSSKSMIINFSVVILFPWDWIQFCRIQICKMYSIVFPDWFIRLFLSRVHCSFIHFFVCYSFQFFKVLCNEFIVLSLVNRGQWTRTPYFLYHSVVSTIHNKILIFVHLIYLLCLFVFKWTLYYYDVCTSNACQ